MVIPKSFAMFSSFPLNMPGTGTCVIFAGNILQLIKRNYKIAGTVMLLLLIAFAGHAQGVMVLRGSIIIKGGKSIPYRLELTDSAGFVKGYSITYSEPDEAKAVVAGKVDRDKKRLVFREQSLVYSKGFHPEALCMINATLDYNAAGKTLNGPITSKDAGNTNCTGGRVVFNAEDEITAFFAGRRVAAPVEDKDEDMTPAVTPPPDDKYNMTITMKGKVRKDTTTKKVAAEEKKAEPLVTEKITAGVEKAYTWYSDSLVIDVWDNGNIDGDRVSVQFDGKTVLAGHYLTKEKKHLSIPISAGEHTLAIVADNEGSDPPNTATLLLTDAGKQHSIMAHNPRGGISLIRIRKGK